nr:uncharacterized protein LOC121122947 [Lepeophtheirus salmonis]
MSNDLECFICLTPSESFCDHCKIPYCSENHFQFHKSSHNGSCLPFRAFYKPELGRYVVATRDIEPLEVILEDKAAVFGPNHDTKPVCLECLKPLNEEDHADCPNGCGYPLCNNQDCWNGPNHNIECEIFRNLKTNFKMKVKFNRIDNMGKELKLAPEYGCITPLRLAASKYKDKKLWSLLQSLMDHDVERRKEEKYWKMFQVGHTYINIYNSYMLYNQ